MDERLVSSTAYPLTNSSLSDAQTPLISAVTAGTLHMKMYRQLCMSSDVVFQLFFILTQLLCSMSIGFVRVCFFNAH